MTAASHPRRLSSSLETLGAITHRTQTDRVILHIGRNGGFHLVRRRADLAEPFRLDLENTHEESIEIIAFIERGAPAIDDGEILCELPDRRLFVELSKRAAERIDDFSEPSVDRVQFPEELFLTGDGRPCS